MRDHYRRRLNPIVLYTVPMALGIILPSNALAQLVQVPPRFSLDSLQGVNAVPVIYESISANFNPFDPSHFNSGSANFDAEITVVGFAKRFTLFDRSALVAVLVPMGRLSGETTIAGNTFTKSASGIGDPMLEFNLNLLGSDPIKNIPDVMRYEPGFKLDLVVDLAFPIGEYDNDEALNIGQNRWYGRVGTPITIQIGDWVPSRRSTLELFPSVWFFSDNNDLVGQSLETDPVFQLDAHLTRDFTDDFWGSLDLILLSGGGSSLNGMSGDSFDSLSVGFTLGHEITSNLQFTVGYSTTIDDSGTGDLQMDVFRISLVYGWHQLVEGMERLMEGG